MNAIKLVFIFSFLSNLALAQINSYSFSKYFTKTNTNDWIQFGQISTLPTGNFIKVRAWSHYGNQLFFSEFHLAATTYGNPALEWVEIAPVLASGWNGAPNFALDARYKCDNSCAMELRLRRLSGGGGAGEINFTVESNAVFVENDIQETDGVVSPGYLGNSSGWKFPSVASRFSSTEEGLFIQPSGNVGIGTISPTEKLAVNGKIRAKEIKVEAAPWPDYVFHPSYKLPDLKATEQFIKENNHLPEIPSAAEVEENGVNLGEMNAKLLKKIEELTLHLIQLQKQVERLEHK